MTAASMKLFGYGDFAVRFPSALFGTLTVLLTFFLVKELFRNSLIVNHLSLITSFFLAVSPWSVHFSRSGYEANVAIFFIVFATYLFLKNKLIFSSLLYSLSIWTYLTPRIFVPLFVSGLAFMYRKELWKKKYLAVAAFIVAIVFLLPIARMSLSREGQMRASGVSAFANPDDIKKSVSRLTIDRGVFRLFDNRRVLYAITFLRGYFSHFDPNFLFLDKSIEKYRAPDTGLLYLFELPLILAGFYMLVKKWSRESAILFWWIIVSPVAAAFTLQLPHPVRTLVFLPTFQILSAIGLVTIWGKIKKLRVFCVVIIILSVAYYLHQYFMFLSIENASYWYVGRKEMVQKIAQYEKGYDKIYVSNSLDFPYIFYLYYRPVDPQVYPGTVSGGFKEEGNHYGNVQFRSINSSLRDPSKKILFAGPPNEVFKQSLVVDTVYYPDHTPAIVFFR
jgi:4-amino-4-deoxy-L-arabinose transferase-like glycosyltransferase